MDAEKLMMQKRIDNLQEHIDYLHGVITDYERQNAKLKAEMEAVKRERDAVIKDAKEAGCETCEFSDFDMPQCKECNCANGYKWYVKHRRAYDDN